MGTGAVARLAEQLGQQRTRPHSYDVLLCRTPHHPAGRRAHGVDLFIFPHRRSERDADQ